jgi:hypothetical protein
MVVFTSASKAECARAMPWRGLLQFATVFVQVVAGWSVMKLAVEAAESLEGPLNSFWAFSHSGLGEMPQSNASLGCAFFLNWAASIMALFHAFRVRLSVPLITGACDRCHNGIWLGMSGIEIGTRGNTRDERSFRTKPFFGQSEESCVVRNGICHHTQDSSPRW